MTATGSIAAAVAGAASVVSDVAMSCSLRSCGWGPGSDRASLGFPRLGSCGREAGGGLDEDSGPVRRHTDDGPALAGGDLGDRLGLAERLRRAGIPELSCVVVMVEQQGH